MSVRPPLIALATVLALLVALPATALAKRTVPTGFYGINWDMDVAGADVPPDVQEAQFAKMAVAGVETLRTNFAWTHAQPNYGEPIDYTYMDRVVQLASEHGIRVLPVVITAPPWARGQVGATFSPPHDNKQYAGFLKALIARYGPNGSFWTLHGGLRKMPIRTWQIWNEPELAYQWTIPKDRDWAKTYVAMLKVAYKAVHQADKGATVALAGLTNNSPSDLKQLYKAGARGYFDVGAIHPYTAKPDGVITLLKRFRKVMKDNRDGSKRIWTTELGMPASKGRSNSHNSLQTTDSGMAKFLHDVYPLLVRTRTSKDVGSWRAFWYTWATPYDGNAIFRYSGLLQYRPGEATTQRPAYNPYVRSARKYEGCVKRANGSCR